MDDLIGRKVSVVIGDVENHTTENGKVTDHFLDDNLQDWVRVKLDESSFLVTVPWERVVFTSITDGL